MNIIKARQELLMGKTIYDMELRVVDYGRVSTDKDDQINSLENQVHYFHDMIQSIEKWTHIHSYVDEGISGTQVNKREQFLKMIEDARQGKFDLIVTKEVSRFARNTIDSIQYTELLLQYGVIVFFISDNINTIYPDSEFRLTLMASMAQDEVRKLSERVKFGIKRSIKDGKLGGGALTGYYKKDGKLVINEQEAPMIQMIFSLYATGKYGFQKIGEILKEHGYSTKKGKVYSDTTIKKMIKNYRYKGYYTANLSRIEDYKTHKKKALPREEWIVYKDQKGIVPPIVSEELWNRANEIYQERLKRRNKNVLNKSNLLENRSYTSKIFCKEHHKAFIRCACGKRKENPVWQCNEYVRHGLKACKTPILYEKQLHKIFTNLINQIISNKKELYHIMIRDYQMLYQEKRKDTNLSCILSQMKEQENCKDKLLDLSLRGLINEEDFKAKYQKVEDELQRLKQEAKTSSKEWKNPLQNKMEEEIKQLLNVEKNIKKYFDLFIDKVFVSKINQDRKHLQFEIIFNFDHLPKIIEVHMQNKKNQEKELQRMR